MASPGSADAVATHWVCKHQRELTTVELYAILQLRSAVFVVEQNCVFLDLDGIDLADENHHLMAWRGNVLVGCARLLDPATHDGNVVIGRVVTATHARGGGLGHALMEQALHHCALLWPDMPIALSAQAHLQHYYGRHGFVAFGDIYLEDDIPHVGMRRA